MNWSVEPSAIKAIPTLFDGIKYRSRLEAKWACFFGKMGWDFEYEPLDLDHYIPDFVLNLTRPVLVEIKPACSLDELWDYADSLEHLAGWNGLVLLCGISPFKSLGKNISGKESIGLIVGKMMEPGCSGWYNKHASACREKAEA